MLHPGCMLAEVSSGKGSVLSVVADFCAFLFHLSTDKNQVVFGGSCGDPNNDPEWKQILPEGEWEVFNNGECDNDQDMCALHDCRLKANSLSSLYIPEKLSVSRP